jgi:hypothetical protein
MDLGNELVSEELGGGSSLLGLDLHAPPHEVLG